MCLTRPLYRAGLETTNAAGEAAYRVPLGGPLAPGTTWTFQVAYVDAVGAGYNFSDAVAVTLVP